MVFPHSPSGLKSADVPVTPGPEQARQWAQEELAQQVYEDAQPGWAQQLGKLLLQALTELLENVGVAPGNVGLLIVVSLLVIAVLIIVLVLRPTLNRHKRSIAAVFADTVVLSSNEHRARATQAAAAADYSTAVTEQFRALVRAAEERDISMPAPGRTALEIVTELERAFPDHAKALHRSAELFSLARYGRIPPTAAMFEELCSVDQALAGAPASYEQNFATVLP